MSTWYDRPDLGDGPPLCDWWTDDARGISRCTKWAGHDGEHEHGQVELLPVTWQHYGGKPTDPAEQARIAQQYMRDRYGKHQPPEEA